METKGRFAVTALKTVYIHDFNCFTPLGADLEANWQRLVDGKGGIERQHLGALGAVCVAKVPDSLFAALPPYDETRLARMLLAAAVPVRARRGASKRTALVLATTKGDITALQGAKTEEAMLSLLAKKVAAHIHIETEPIVLSHACVSGVLAISVAKRLLQMGQYDDAYVLAGDELSEFVVSGFQAFQAMSPVACKPFDKDRQGVSLGEAAACVYLSTTPGDFAIAGESAINDANHISGPSRTGEGLYQSVQAALLEAGLPAAAIDFISAHGTATAYNDEMEAIAFNRLGLATVPLHSLKGYYGHTLGASGLLETTIALKSMQEQRLIPTLGFEQLGTTQSLAIVQAVKTQRIQRILKTASGFGGSNAAMIIEKI